ncbi:hypothetical protein GGR56DRAFT_22593 [Xylariaceae sp. FL0804]|nr:hypothetical protein GGR56DRAFT_22593 [Xylariaceae sp. FL0804]
MLGDEIVVGTHVNGDKPSPLQVVSDGEDGDIADSEEHARPGQYSKRKRSSLYNDLDESKMDASSFMEGIEQSPAMRSQGKPRQSLQNAKNVILGYWRDSPVPIDKAKHAVIGFMDVRDRLRTRIQNITRAGEPINTRLFPIPPGPGGSWVTFERVVFDKHLVGLDHNEIKEYVKVRTSDQAGQVDDNPDTNEEAALAAVREAKRRLEISPPAEQQQPPAIAWGLEIPEHVQLGNRPEAKRRRVGSTTSVATERAANERAERSQMVSQSPQQLQAQPQVLHPPQPPVPSPQQQQQQLQHQQQQLQHQQQLHQHQQPQLPSQLQHPLQPPPPHPGQFAPHNLQHHQQQQQVPQAPQPLDQLVGTRPTRILVGAWAKSIVEDERDRHAVYGILGANDMFRVKLVRETMDGRYVDGNFPLGAGALWINYEDVIFMKHVSHLNRGEMKEYVRVRQWQIDCGETEEERVANETKAVYEAQARAVANPKGAVAGARARLPVNVAIEPEDVKESPKADPNVGGGHELRHARREMMPRNEMSLPRHPLPEPPSELRHRPASVDTNERVERVNGLASREVARMEAAQMRHDQRQQPGRMTPMAGPPGPMDPVEHQRAFQENRDRMQRVWVAQETNRNMRPPPMEAPPPQQQQQQQLPHAHATLDAKVHNGIKYERKHNGPFQGKLVSQGAIITIDGEDYVEYRVLTKPTFF